MNDKEHTPAPKLYIDLDELKARIKALKGHDDCAYDEGWNDAVQAIQIEVIPGIAALPASLLDAEKVLERGGMILYLQHSLATAERERDSATTMFWLLVKSLGGSASIPRSLIKSYDPGNAFIERREDFESGSIVFKATAGPHNPSRGES